jgi:hypothetical protein
MDQQDLTKVTRHSCLEYLHQFRVHELVIIRDIQTYQTLAEQELPVLFLNLVAVCLFHDENDIRPLDLFTLKRINGVIIGSGRRNLKIVPSCEHLFGSGAAQFVLTADE